MAFTPAPGWPDQLSDFTLVVGCAGAANVGQLAAELLITSLALTPAGWLTSAHVLPCAGNDALQPPGTGTLALPLELHACRHRRLAVLLQRAPAVQGRQTALAAELAAWAARASVGRALLLAGLDGREAGGGGAEAQIGAAALRFCAAAGGCWLPDAALRLTQLEGETVGDVPLAEARAPPWPLLRALPDAGVPAALALTLFASEGDNSGHARVLAQAAAAVAGAGAVEWRQPPSWASAFGATRAVARELYA